MHTQQARNDSARPRGTETRHWRCRTGPNACEIPSLRGEWRWISQAPLWGFRRADRLALTWRALVSGAPRGQWSAQRSAEFPAVSGAPGDQRSSRRRPSGCPVTPTAPRPDTPVMHGAPHAGPASMVPPIRSGPETARPPAFRRSLGERHTADEAVVPVPATASGGPPRARGPSCRSPRARAECGTLPSESCASSSSPPHPGAQDHSATAGADAASMKRARIAFMFPSCRCDTLPATGRSSVGRKIPGFASPPRDGFALDESRIGQRPSLPSRNYAPAAGRAMRHRYQRTASRISR